MSIPEEILKVTIYEMKRRANELVESKARLEEIEEELEEQKKWVVKHEGTLKSMCAFLNKYSPGTVPWEEVIGFKEEKENERTNQ